MIANIQHWTELIAKKLSGNIREDEARMLDAWIARDPEHREYYDQLAHVWAATGSVGELPAPGADWAAIEKRLGEGRVMSLPKVPRPKVSRAVLRRYAAVAAVAVVAVFAVSYLFRAEPVVPPAVVQVTGAKPQEVTLPDGSKVVLRQGSKLTYHPDFAERNVTLEGEGFFDVTHDELNPFSVTAGSGTVRVLGTRFNIKTIDGSRVELYVEEGQVAFAPAKQKYEAKIFSEGQAGVIDPGSSEDVERIAPPGPNLSSWINGRLVFDHVPLNNVIRDLERHFGVTMEVADSALYACELKADFAQATLNDVLETLRFSLNLEIDSTGSSYLITGEPCAMSPETE